MADFNVDIRRDFRDISGLVLDVSADDFEIESGRIARWFNRAPQALTGGARFGDPFQANTALRPSPGGNLGARFNRGAGEFLSVPLVGTFGAASLDWTFAMYFTKTGGIANDQTIIGADGGTFRMQRRNGVGDFAYDTDPPPAGASGSGDIPNGGHVLALKTGGTADWIVNNGSPFAIAGGAASPVAFTADVDNSLYLGRDTAGGDELDGELIQMLIWQRQLSDKELDLLWRNLDGVDRSSGVGPDGRATVESRVWQDATGDLSLRQINRLNPIAGRQHRYFIGTIPSGASAAIMQLAANTGGLVLPDTALGGDLYSAGFVESASNPTPLITQDAGWSSVWDIRVAEPGHYTLLVERPNHGALYVHFDVEALP